MKYCAEQGCRNLISKGRYCSDHRRRPRKRKSRYKYQHKNKSFYNSAVWRRTREYIYERDKGCCQRCGKFVFGRDAHVHHIVPIQEDESMKLEPTNLKLLCKDCHMIEENEVKEVVEPNYPSYFFR